VNGNKKFWNWKPRISDDAEVQPRVLEISGEIGSESWFGDEVTPAEFKKELYSDTGPVTVWINSPGGDCIAASRIYTMLTEYPDEVTVKIDGIAASAASVIAMAGSKVLMSPTSLMMIHNPMTSAYGDHNEMEKAKEMLAEVKESIINAYELKTKLSRAKIDHFMESETWFNAKKAIALGFADGLLGDEKLEFSTDDEMVFSPKQVEACLLNKMQAKDNPEPKKTGRKIADLERDLQVMKQIFNFKEDIKHDN
jgi:ATP-dependent Clp protease protease subunit